MVVLSVKINNQTSGNTCFLIYIKLNKGVNPFLCLDC
mgnify:CR=1 FL=1